MRLFLLLFVLAYPVVGQQKSAFQEADFTKVSKFERLPPQVRNEFLSLIHNEPFADPGKKWNPGDVIWDEKVPRRRLIFGGASGSTWFIYYEHGGRGLHEHLVVFKSDKAGHLQVVEN